MRPALFALLLAASPALAEIRPNLDPAAPAAPGAVALLLTAQNLYALGQAGKDPLLVVTAARMMRGLALIESPRIPESTGKPALGDHTLPDPEAMFATARALDPGETLTDLIEAIATETPPPPKALRATASQLAPGLSDIWTIPFYGGSYAELAILGSATGNLDLSITDAGGALICQDNGSADTAYCGFVPRDNGDFTVTVINSGQSPDAYQLITN